MIHGRRRRSTRLAFHICVDLVNSTLHRRTRRPIHYNNGLTKFPFQYPVGNPVPTAQYRFRRTLRFSPTGECRINSTYDVRTVVEVGLLQTHGNVTPTPSPSPGQYPGNVIAVRITGFGGNVKIYRR